MFGTEELPPPPATVPPEVIDCLVDDPPISSSEPVPWSEYLPDGMLADLLAEPAQTGLEHREFESLKRIGGWEWVIAWAQAQQLREITSFMERAEARNAALGAYTSLAHDAAVAEVGLVLRVSPRGRQVPLLGHQHVNDLPELVDRPVQIDPPASDFDVGLVEKPPMALLH